ncbi:pancreatic lipase-related protein 2-like isoform X2 [Spodoptera litura]|uniref:Pancreatic lipase-related protein 2-like isoform X2 n=1 Tax=Spodoptera litura TaxID=69820 RepID=A0A9J7EQ68_SPOLT|nr:pancreatic lipase-related protein 2-like isoform X2 [Spodoptera litura]
MQSVVPLACFLSLIRPPGVQYENALLQIAPVDKAKCPYVHAGTDVSFQLYTRHNPTVPQRLALDDDELLFASSIDWNSHTVVYFHAFMEQPEDGSAVLVREAYMQRGDSNVIMVDAARLEAGPWYPAAAHNTWYVGQYAARLLDYLAARGLRLNHTHLVGHSLGAHAAGVAGAALRTGRVARITGLDPALPLFAGVHPDQRLDPSDADFVDVIHTDAGIFGYKHPLGHADFFPNGGASPQPGCELEVVLPQQLLLNKCAGMLHPRHYFVFELTTAPVHSRHKRFLPALRRDTATDSWPTLGALGVLGALVRGAPLVSVVRDVTTRVKSSAGELAHVARETSRYVGRDPAPLPGVTLELGAGGWWGALRKLLGLAPPGARLSVAP